MLVEKENLITHIAECGRRIGAYFLGRSVPPLENSVKLGRGYLILAALSGLLLALAYPGWSFGVGSGPAGGLSFLVWIGLIPLFWSLKIFASIGGHFYKRKLFTLGFSAGLVYFLLVFRWLWSVYPLDTLGLDSHVASFFIVLILWLVSAAGMAVFWGLFVAVYSLQFTVYSKSWFGSVLKKLVTGHWSLVTFPVLFVLLESLRSWGFGILWAGSGSLFGPHWTMGNFAYSLAGHSSIRWLISYIGIYGVTFIIVFVNLLFAKLLPMVLFMRPHKKYHGLDRHGLGLTVTLLVVVVILFFAVSSIDYFRSKPRTLAESGFQTLNYAIIQTQNPTRLVPSPQETLTNFKQELEMLKRVAKEYPETQIVVFPEASDFFKNLSLFLTSAQAENFFKNLFPNPTLVIVGGRVIEPETGLAHSRAFSLDTKGDIIGFYDKRLLTPGGEFLPYPLRFVTNLFSRGAVSQFGEFRELAVGQRDVSTVGFRYQFNAAPVICSEFWSPRLVAQTTQNSDVIIGMSSYGVFRGNLNIVKQNLAAARLRAAENRKPMLAASNMGLSYAIDSRGNIIKIFPNSAPGLLTGSVYIRK